MNSAFFSLMPQAFIEHLLCAWHCDRSWGQDLDTTFKKFFLSLVKNNKKLSGQLMLRLTLHRNYLTKAEFGVSQRFCIYLPICLSFCLSVIG